MRENPYLEYYLQKDSFPEGLDENQKFTTLSLMRGQMGMDISVVGSLENIMNLVCVNSKSLLKG